MNDIWNQVRDGIEAEVVRIIGTNRKMSKLGFNNICEEALQRRKTTYKVLFKYKYLF